MWDPSRHLHSNPPSLPRAGLGQGAPVTAGSGTIRDGIHWRYCYARRVLQQHPKAPVRIRYPVCCECVKLLSDTAPASGNWFLHGTRVCFSRGEDPGCLFAVTSHRGLCSNGSVARESAPCTVEKAMVLLGFTPVGFVLLWQNWDGMDGIGWMGSHPFPWAAVAFGWGIKQARTSPAEVKKNVRKNLGHLSRTNDPS